MRLKRGVVELPQGQEKGTIESIKGNQNLRNFLLNAGLEKIAKVFRDFEPKDTLMQLEDGEIVKVQDFSLVFKLSFDPNADVMLIIDSLKSYSDVIYAEPNYLGIPLYNVNDDSFPKQWYLKQANDCDIDAELAWDIERGNSSIRIGIVDDGIDYHHRDFGGAMGSNYKVKGGRRYSLDGTYINDPHPWYDNDVHGTHVAGIASALTNNDNIGIAGVSGGSGGSDIGCSMYGYCIKTHGGLTPVEIFVLGLGAAADMTHVINASYGYEYSEVLREKCVYAYKLSRTLVASRGNYYELNPDSLLYPACYDPHLVISVGATYYNDLLASFSNIGQGLDVVAPGVDIISTVPVGSPNEEKYQRMSGTSMSAPLVTGLAALIRSRAYEKGISLQPEDVEGIIRATAYDPPWSDPGYDDEYGAGRINAYDALRFFDTPNSIRRYTVYANNWAYCGTYPLWLIGLPNLADDQYQVEIWEVRSNWFSLPTDMIQFLGIWGLGRLTSGYSFLSQQIPHYGEGWCGVEKHPTSAQYRTKTYVYAVWNLDFSHFYGWWPCEPSDVTFKYSLFSVNVLAPYNLRAENITQTSLTLKWNYDYPALIDGYVVKRDGAVIANPPPGVTELEQTGLEPGHLYYYEVYARKGSIYSTPTTLHIGTVPTGALAQSDYSRMSAFNNGTKVVRGPDGKIHIIYYNGSHVYYSYSTDGGVSFAAPWQQVCSSDTIPVLATDANGTLWIVNATHYFPNLYTCALEYYLYKKTDIGWQKSYDEIYRKEISAQYPNVPALLHPPSFVIVGDSGYIAFQELQNWKIIVSQFLLGMSTYYQTRVISQVGGNYPSIGYDKAGRIVVVVREYESGFYQRLKLYFRTIGNSTWHMVDISGLSDVWADGSPSLWAGQDEIRIALEGYDSAHQGIMFIRLVWSGSTYTVQSTECVSEDIDWPGDAEGYSYLASRDVVLWKAEDDIHYARRIGFGEWQDLGNLSQSGDLSSYPQGVVFGSSAMGQKLFALWTEKSGSNYYLVRKVINLPPAYPTLRTVAQSNIPEATGYNNSRRLIRDAQGVLHLAFTSGDSVYHTYLQDTSWTEPVAIGEGKYPALALDNNGRIHCIWGCNQGLPYFLEELRYSCFDGNQWSAPVPLMHTYNSFLWGIGAPSLAIKDSLAYITFKSYSGPTYHPEPGGPAPQVIILESRNLIYGKFNIDNLLAFAHQSIDAIGITPTPYDPYVYQDSLVPLLISPSIAVDLAGIPHILWEGDSTNMRYYTIVDTNIALQIFDENVDFPFLGMNGDQIQVFYTARDSIRYRYS